MSYVLGQYPPAAQRDYWDQLSASDYGHPRRTIMSGVDSSHYSLLTVDLHLIAQQARQDIERLESARTFIAFLEKVEIEESSRRGLLTLRLPSGESEPRGKPGNSGFAGFPHRPL
jgi:hypothetical protein